MESNLLKTCRSCLRSIPTLRNLFETYTDIGLKLSECYEICANLNISVEDEFPKMICIMCESNLMAAYYFRKQCTEAVKLFLENAKEIISKDSPPIIEEPLVIKQEINEQCETETEEEQETIRMAIDKIEEKNVSSAAELLPESVPQIVQETIPILKESRYFQCPKCQKAFISYRHLEIHLKSHKKDPYVCEICNRKCPSKSVLKIHQKKHRTPVDEKDEILNNNGKDVFVVEYLYGFKTE